MVDRSRPMFKKNKNKTHGGSGLMNMRAIIRFGHRSGLWTAIFDWMYDKADVITITNGEGALKMLYPLLISAYSEDDNPSILVYFNLE